MNSMSVPADDTTPRDDEACPEPGGLRDLMLATGCVMAIALAFAVTPAQAADPPSIATAVVHVR